MLLGSAAVLNPPKCRVFGSAWSAQLPCCWLEHFPSTTPPRPQGDRRAGPSLAAFNFDSSWGQRALRETYRAIMGEERSPLALPQACRPGARMFWAGRGSEPQWLRVQERLTTSVPCNESFASTCVHSVLLIHLLQAPRASLRPCPRKLSWPGPAPCCSTLG